MTEVEAMLFDTFMEKVIGLTDRSSWKTYYAAESQKREKGSLEAWRSGVRKQGADINVRD